MRGTNGRDQRDDRHRQYDFMLLVTCVLSFVAFLFAADFSAWGSSTSRNLSQNTETRQTENVAAAPARQQSAPTPQPVRAILVEAAATKVKATYPDNSNAALPVGKAGFQLFDVRFAGLSCGQERFSASQWNFSSARAPPQSA